RAVAERATGHLADGDAARKELPIDEYVIGGRPRDVDPVKDGRSCGQDRSIGGVWARHRTRLSATPKNEAPVRSALLAAVVPSHDIPNVGAIRNRHIDLPLALIKFKGHHVAV